MTAVSHPDGNKWECGAGCDPRAAQGARLCQHEAPLLREMRTPLSWVFLLHLITSENHRAGGTEQALESGLRSRGWTCGSWSRICRAGWRPGVGAAAGGSLGGGPPEGRVRVPSSAAAGGAACPRDEASAYTSPTFQVEIKLESRELDDLHALELKCRFLETGVSCFL